MYRRWTFLAFDMKQYLDLMRHVYEHGTDKTDRTGTGTRSVFGHQMRFDLTEGFPLVTTKKCHLKSIIYELLWFIQGNTNNNWLKARGVTIWNEWAREDGELGPIYGHQWRSWNDGKGGEIDQLAQVIKQLKNSPDSRRIIVSAWNVGDIPNMALPPCHAFFQFYVANGELSCQCTNAARTYSSACHLTSRPTPCWPTWLRNKQVWSPKSSFGRAATVTCTTTTSHRYKPNSRVSHCPCRNWSSSANPTQYLIMSLRILRLWTISTTRRYGRRWRFKLKKQFVATSVWKR